MKNNKKNLYILVPLMVIVWGGIAYQVIGGLSSGGDEEFDAPEFEIPAAQMQEDTFHYELNLAYNDPFQTSRRRVSRNSRTPINNAANTKNTNIGRKAKTVVTWPLLVYGGIVKSSNQKKVGLLKMGGKSYLAKEGDIFQGVQVKKYTEEEIVLKYSGEEKTIKK